MIIFTVASVTKLLLVCTWFGQKLQLKQNTMSCYSDVASLCSASVCVCVFMCMCVYVCGCAHACMCVCVCAHAHECMVMHAWLCVCACARAHVHVLTHTTIKCLYFDLEISTTKGRFQGRWVSSCTFPCRLRTLYDVIDRAPLYTPPTPHHVYLCDVVWHRAWVPIICVSPCGTNVSKLLTFFFFHSRPLSSVVVNVVLTWTSFQFIKSKTRFDWNHSWEGLD